MKKEGYYNNLDRLAAEKVMGWRLQGAWWMLGETTHINIADWQPTRDIAQSWKMLDKLLSEEPYEVSIAMVYGTWNCKLSLDDPQDPWINSGPSATVTEAIVCACLNARRHDWNET